MRFSIIALIATAAPAVWAIPTPQLPKGGPKGGGAAGACSPLEVIFGMLILNEMGSSTTYTPQARATTEGAGLGLAGRPLVQQVARLVPGSTSYAVRYPVRAPRHISFERF
jgi:hypothetical protein